MAETKQAPRATSRTWCGWRWSAATDAPAWWAPSSAAHRPHLLEAWGSRFNVQLEEHLAVFRYRDQPGMIGRVGTVFGDAGVNIVSAAVGRDRTSRTARRRWWSPPTPVPQAVVDRIAASDGFVAGRTVTL